MLLVAQPYKRGFYCDDETLMHPYLKETVPVIIVGIFAVVVPFMLVNGFLILLNHPPPPPPPHTHTHTHTHPYGKKIRFYIDKILHLSYIVISFLKNLKQSDEELLSNSQPLIKFLKRVLQNNRPLERKP